MVTLNLKFTSLSPAQKTLMFLEFQNNNLGAMFQRETLVALEYFWRGRSLQFFEKVDLTRNDIFKQVRNMAFDFAHIRNMEKAVDRRWDDKASYHFPALLTFDRKMIEVIDLFPLSCSYAIGPNREVIPFSKGDWLATVTGEMTSSQAESVHNLFSWEAVERRSSRIETHRGNLDNTVVAQEQELARAAGISVPPPRRLL